MNRTEFRARIRGLLGDAEPTGNPRFSDSLLDDWIDDEVAEVGAEQPWAYTRDQTILTLVPDVDTYLLPEGTLRVDFVTGSDGSRIDFLNEFAYTDVPGGRSSDPSVGGYTIPGNSPVALRLAKMPTTTGEITVYYFARSPLPTGDGVDFNVPFEFCDVVIFRVAAKCAMRDRNSELVAMFGGEAEMLVRKIAHTQRGTRTSELQSFTLLRAQPNSRRV